MTTITFAGSFADLMALRFAFVAAVSILLLFLI